MADILFVIGPSGIGKSELCSAFQAAEPGAVHANLDLAENAACEQLTAARLPLGGWNERWSRQLEAIQGLPTAYPTADIILADIGAGTLQASDARDFLRTNEPRVIVLSAPFDVVRARRAGRSSEELRSQEFTPERMAFYGAFPHRLDLGHGTVRELLPAFQAAVRTALGASGLAGK